MALRSGQNVHYRYKQIRDDSLEYIQLLFQVTTKCRQQVCIYYKCTKISSYFIAQHYKFLSITLIDYCTVSYNIKYCNIIFPFLCIFHQCIIVC